MPNRLIFENILDCEAYWSVSTDARLLLLHLKLLADDLGCVNLAPVFIRRRCFDDNPSPKKVDLLLRELSDSDQIRIYFHDGRRLGFIPHFRQRLQIEKFKYPVPPNALFEGDTDAQEKVREIREKMAASSAGKQRKTAGKRFFTVAQPPEAEVEEKLKFPSPNGEGQVGGGAAPRPTLPCPHQEIIDLYHETLPTLPRVRQWTNHRRTLLQARWRERWAIGKYKTQEEGLASWKAFFEFVAESRFLMGRGNPTGDRPPFQADLEWLLKPTHFVRVIEGRYHDARSEQHA
jgi:hypothetical protein